MRAFVRRAPDFFQVGLARVVIGRFAEDQLDEAENHRQVIAQRMHLGGIETTPFGLGLHIAIITEKISSTRRAQLRCRRAGLARQTGKNVLHLRP